MNERELQVIKAELIAAYLEVSEHQAHLQTRAAEFTLPEAKDRLELCEKIRTYFQVKDADFAVLRDHLDAIARTVEEMGEASGKAANKCDCAGGSESMFLACQPAPT